MGLPFVIDVAIGLLFIYLILSLLASELQELLTTLLQWRAKHLKDAIEILLAGGVETKEQSEVVDLVDKLYNDPLLKNINQEAKGVVSRGLREVTRWLFPGNRKGAFGHNRSSGPSYIAPETFATSLINSLGISVLAEKLTEVRLAKFINRIVGNYTMQEDGTASVPAPETLTNNWEKGGIRVIGEKVGIMDLGADEKFKILVEDYDDILKDFKSGEAELSTCIDRMGYGLSAYIEACAAYDAAAWNLDAKTKDYFIRRLRSFKLGLFGETNERAILSGGLRPNAFEVADLVNQTSKTYKELENAYAVMETQAGAIAEKVDALVNAQLEEYNKELKKPVHLKNLSNEKRRLFINEALSYLLELGEITDEDRKTYETYTTYQEIKRLLQNIPQPVRDSLQSLAGRAHAKAQQTGDYVNQFRDEIATWFDRSMSRSSGVYKRNAKGVAILIGITLAIITNADSFYIVRRISSDDDLRRVVTERATQIAPGTTAKTLTVQELDDLKDRADAALQDLILPIGWNPPTVIRQFRCNINPAAIADPDAPVSRAQERADLRRACLGPQAAPNMPVILQLIVAKPVEFLLRLLGWLVTGIAIAMGAPFWFDLLSKVINVRNSGSKPPSPTQTTGK